MEPNALAAPKRTSLVVTSSSSDTLRTSCSDDHGSGKPDMVHEHADSSDGSIAKMRGPTKREKLRGLKKRTKAKTKKLLHIHGGAPTDGELDEDEGGVLDNIEADPAFNSGKLVREKPLTVGGAAKKTADTFHSFASAVVNPSKKFKSKATRTAADQLAKAERPFLSQNADRELLAAHEDLRSAQTPSSTSHGISEEKLNALKEESSQMIEELEKHRESLAVAYTTTRHLHRVRVVKTESWKFPERETFIERDSNGVFMRYLWAKWLGYVSLPYSQAERYI